MIAIIRAIQWCNFGNSKTWLSVSVTMNVSGVEIEDKKCIYLFRQQCAVGHWLTPQNLGTSKSTATFNYLQQHQSTSDIDDISISMSAFLSSYIQVLPASHLVLYKNSPFIHSENSIAGNHKPYWSRARLMHITYASSLVLCVFHSCLR